MPDTLRSQDFTTNLFSLLEETFESPPKGGNAYLDRETGWFHTLNVITAEQASRPVAPGGTSIAGQLEHTRFYLETLAGFMTGRLTQKVDWSESWRVQTVDAGAWETLQNDFGAAYTCVEALLGSYTDWGDDQVGDALAILAHSAYHLGAVRQMVRVMS